ncbi:MAG TPA: hypothetical protein VD931_14470, partial [Baekduia sp.]|nr:hypothetical protein [Baekduia sp.]
AGARTTAVSGRLPYAAHPALSGDGRRVAFTASGRRGAQEVRVRTLDGSAPERRITAARPGPVLHPACDAAPPVW